MKKNRSTPKNYFIKNRANLINKISDAMSMKYNNFFTAANYGTKALKEDIDKLLTTQYYSKDPRDVFKPIETNILEIVKQKNPKLQVKVKKARKLPEIKYLQDKYQEANEIEKVKEKTKVKEEKKEEKTNRKNSNIPKKTRTPNTQNTLSKRKNNNKENKNMSKGKINKENNKKEDLNNNIDGEYRLKHTLVDQLNNRIKYDPTIKILEEEKKLYEKEKEEIKQKKKIDQINYLNELKIQIEEKDKLKEIERKNKIKEYEEIQKQIIYDNEKQKEREMNEKLKREKLKENYENIIKEKDNIKRKQKIEEDKENKLLVEKLNDEINNEKKNILEKKNKIKEEYLKTKEINDRLIQEKMQSKNSNNGIGKEQQDMLFKPNSLSNDVIRNRINKRVLEQEAASNHLMKIYNSLEKQNLDSYIAEREKQEQKDKLRYELADKNRQMKIEDYKRGLLDTLAYKNQEREKQKEEDARYKKSLEDEYALYLKQEKEKEMKKFEKYENYRKALEDQIKENKLRDFERMKYK